MPDLTRCSLEGLDDKKLVKFSLVIESLTGLENPGMPDGSARLPYSSASFFNF